MMVNQEAVNGRWLEIKGEVQKAWGKLSANDLEKTRGDLHLIAGLVREKYGEQGELFERKMAQIVAPFEEKRRGALVEIPKNISA